MNKKINVECIDNCCMCFKEFKIGIESYLYVYMMK